MADRQQQSLMRCAFCGRGSEAVNKLVAGPGVYICDECIGLCQEALRGSSGGSTTPPTSRPPLTPVQLCQRLDEYVVGQADSKRALCVAVYNHYKRIAESSSDDRLDKSNVLMIGPTGSGKTLLAQTLARILDVPFSMADATALTEAGYVGEDVENILVGLLRAADFDVARAQRGIVYIDEIDKIARRGAGPSLSRDVSGEGVQQALLRIIEGTVANVPTQAGRKTPQQEYVQIDTSQILFICGGAFDGLDALIAKRTSHAPLGFQPHARRVGAGQPVAEVSSADLVSFGLIPEFVGRLPILTRLAALTEEDVVYVLTEPKNSLVAQFTRLFALDGVELSFEGDALLAIAREALARGSGARGLRAIVENRLLDSMFDNPGRTDVSACVVTVNAVLTVTRTPAGDDCAQPDLEAVA